MKYLFLEEKVKKKNSIAFFVGRRKFAFEDSLFVLSILLRTRSAQRLILQHFAAVSTPNIAELVPFLSTTMVFAAVQTDFPRKNTSMITCHGKRNE